MKMTERGEAGTYEPDQGSGRKRHRDGACMNIIKFIIVVGFVVFLVATSKARLLALCFSRT